MQTSKRSYKSIENLEEELVELRHQLEEANETIEAIRTGQVDALVVQGDKGHQLYTLKGADQTYRVFIEKMTEGAVTLNSAGIILYSNSQFARMVDRPLSDVIGLPFYQFIAHQSRMEYAALFAACWKHDCKAEVLLGSESIPVQLSLTTLELEEGVSLSIILTDLTNLKAVQQQLRNNNQQLEETNKALEASNHDLQQFASVASHDLQEPLRKIQVFSNLLKEKENCLSEYSQKYLDKVLESSARMRNLIIDILNYSRLSANQQQIERIDLNQLVYELQEDFELIIQDKNAVIQVGELPFIVVNKGQVRQVFQNIMSNALKFSKQGIAPVVRINAYLVAEKSFDSIENEKGQYCLITIADNGIGFDPKYVDNIFALFERLNAKDLFEGTGIGLAIAKKVIDKHDGLITAVSEENKGSEFKIILPLTQSQ